MAIRVRHDPVEAIGQAARKTGQLEAAERATERTGRMYAAAMRMKHEKEMAQYRYDLDLRRRKMAEDWDLKKMELASQHDFAMAEQRKEALFQRELAKELKEKDILDAKKKALEEAEHLSPEEKELYILRLETGLPIRIPSAEDAALLQLNLGESDIAIPNLEEPDNPLRQLYKTAKESKYKSMVERGAKYGLPFGWPGFLYGMYGAMPPKRTTEAALPKISSEAEFNALPKGTRFIDPQGNVRIK